MNFVPGSQRVEISNFLGLIFLKGKLVQPKTVAGVSFNDTEGSWKVWGKSDYWFPIEPKKKSVNFVPGSQRVKISTLVGLFFVKGTLVHPKTVAAVSSSDTERPCENWGKSEYSFPIQPTEKSVNFVPASLRMVISTFMVWFFLKDTLLEPKTLAGVSSYDSERSWEVWGKTDSWFPIQPRKKSANFVPAS